METSTAKAIIFDMDGTLIDSEPLHLLAYQELLEQFEHVWTAQDNREFLGRTDFDVCKAMVSKFNLSLTARQLVERKEHVLQELVEKNAHPRPGVLEILNAAAELKVPMAVASSATLATIAFTIDALGIRKYFSTLSSGEEVSSGKPDPAVFLLAAQRLKVPAQNCLVVEDTLNGIKAAKAAGMYCVAVPCEATSHEDHSLADCRLQSLTELNLQNWLKSGVCR